MVEHLSCAARDHQDGVFNKVTNDVYEITGRQAEDYKDYVKRNIELSRSEFPEGREVSHV